MEDAIAQALKSLLTTSHAHMTFQDAIVDFPMDRINDLPPHVSYSPWMLLEHIRIAQKDIIYYMNPGEYKEPEWPKDYWPATDTKADETMWNKTLKDYQEDLIELTKLLDSKQDLLSKVRDGAKASVLTELLIIADHTAYHLGEFAILRDVMDTWPISHKK